MEKFFIGYAIIILAIFIGWIKNIIWIINQDPIIFNGEAIISIIGVVLPPLGGIVGFFH